MIALHLPMLKFPFHWDELGQFVPASLDLYQDGSLVAHSTLPNVHPPGVMAIVALTWRIFGVSVAAARVAMLVVASAGLLFSFLLAIRLCRGSGGRAGICRGVISDRLADVFLAIGNDSARHAGDDVHGACAAVVPGRALRRRAPRPAPRWC